MTSPIEVHLESPQNLAGIHVSDARPEWRPSMCGKCGQVFGPLWQLDCSPSGEPIWRCLRCGIPHAESTAALVEGFVHSEPAEGYLYPMQGNRRFTQVVQLSSLAKVDSIREQALSLGWNEPRLYQNRGQFRFPYGEDSGLVCYIFETVETVYGDRIIRNRRIGEVTRQHIQIICDNFAIRPHRDEVNGLLYYTRHPAPNRACLCYYNPDVDQPWLKRDTAVA